MTVPNEPLPPPLPPVELRRLVCHDDALFNLPGAGELVFPYLSDASQYRSVFDFGCGCGRIARQLMAQSARPNRYIGVDIHRGMVEWCQNNLTRANRDFAFFHHDVWNMGLGADNSRQTTAPFPAETGSVTLAIAHSVFTHVYKEQTEYYLREFERILADDGVARTTWFLFDRSTFPMLFDFQVALYVNEVDATNAVIYDWRWVLETLTAAGLRVKHVVPAHVAGHQWEIYLEKRRGDEAHAFPLDEESHRRMCGSSTAAGLRAAPVAAAQVAPATEQAPVVAAEPARVGHLLRYTGGASEEEFKAKCAELPWWYHSYYFENAYGVRGDYDIGVDVGGYGFPKSLKGMRVLDIGTGAGWFAHYFEQLGAKEVVTVDARGYCDFDVYGRAGYEEFDAGGREPDRLLDDGRPVYYSPVSQGFWIMKDLLGSGVKYRNGRVYDVSPALVGEEKFDLVFMGAILCHLRDPIGALMAARSVCRHRIIASTPVVLGERDPAEMPLQYMPYTAVDKISWWLPNEGCFREWFLAAGFINVDVSRQVKLSADLVRYENGKAGNGDQILRVGTAFVE